MTILTSFDADKIWCLGGERERGGGRDFEKKYKTGEMYRYLNEIASMVNTLADWVVCPYCAGNPLHMSGGTMSKLILRSQSVGMYGGE